MSDRNTPFVSCSKSLNAVPRPVRLTSNSGVRASTSVILNPVTWPLNTNGALKGLGCPGDTTPEDGNTNGGVSKRKDPARPNGPGKDSPLPRANSVPLTVAANAVPRVKAAGSRVDVWPDPVPATRLKSNTSPGRH